MLTTDVKRVSILNTQIAINNKRMEGYTEAANEAEVSVMKLLFSRLVETSSQCCEELSKEVYKLGGVPETGTNGPADFPKAWTEIKNALAEKDQKAILNACDMEEFMAIKSYEYALRYCDFLTTQHNRLFLKQHGLLEEDHKKVKNLKNVLLRSAEKEKVKDRIYGLNYQNSHINEFQGFSLFSKYKFGY